MNNDDQIRQNIWQQIAEENNQRAALLVGAAAVLPASLSALAVDMRIAADVYTTTRNQAGLVVQDMNRAADMAASLDKLRDSLASPVNETAAEPVT